MGRLVPARLDGNGTTANPADDLLPLEEVQVRPDGHGRDSQEPREILHLHPPPALQRLQDSLMPFARFQRWHALKNPLHVTDL